MLQDLNDDPTTAELVCDVAIVGAGPAGLTLVRQLMGTGLALCLIESGGRDFEPAIQSLAEGESLGAAYYDLAEARLRFFGGTANIWGGRCARFEDSDFLPREWVPRSGWPFSGETLAPHYAAAAGDLELSPAATDNAGWTDPIAGELGIDACAFVTRRWFFDDRHERFHMRRAGDILASPRVTVLLHATVTHIQANQSADHVEALTLATPGGRRRTLRARYVVLACGGIENARLLLAADDIEPQGIGNAHDQVGRCFMEHPHGRVGTLPPRAGFALWAAFQRHRLADGSRVAPVLLPSPALQREAGILNAALTFKLQRDPAAGLSLRKRIYRGLKHRLPPNAANRRLWHTWRDLRKGFQRSLRKPVERLRLLGGMTRVNVMIRSEQAPDPASRVMLSAGRDGLGVRRAVLHWRRGALEKHTARVLVEHLGAKLEHLGIGVVTPSAWLLESGTEWPVDPTVSNHPIAGYHHMGTTRMSNCPADGVVDPNCRVHGYDNLFVAGSSVFPTASWANPTLTILALSRRLGVHLGRLARRG